MSVMTATPAPAGEAPSVQLLGWFASDGSGIAAYSRGILGALSAQEGPRVEPLDVDRWWTKLFPSQLRLLARRRSAHAVLRKAVRRGRHGVLHVLDVGLLPPPSSPIGRRTICSVYDLYAFDPRFLQQAAAEHSALGARLALRMAADRRASYDGLARVDRVVAISSETAEGVVAKCGVPRERVVVIPPVIPDEYVPVAARSSAPRFVIGYVNNFFRNKTRMLRVFLETFQRLADPDLELHIYGPGFPFGRVIRNNPRIRYGGYVPGTSLPRLHASFDAFLTTEEYSGFGIPAMQSKACRVPVLCYDGDVPAVAKRNTVTWTPATLEDVLRSRRWQQVDLAAAEGDVLPCRPAAVRAALTRAYLEALHGSP